MPHPFGIRPLIFGAGLFIAGVAVGAGLAGWAPSRVDGNIRKGATLMSILPESVMSLTYATSLGMTTAQRSAPDVPFQILSTFADGRPVQRCSTAAADMGELLDDLVTLTARRGLSLEERASEFPIQLGVIEVRDSTIAEPSGPVLVFTNKDRTAVAVIVDGHAAEVTLEAAKFEWLETACSGRSLQAKYRRPAASLGPGQ
jgi:hypothetical protein